MDIREMECIVAVVEEGTVSKAAEKLFLTQPTVSRIVAKIESKVGTNLFDKSRTPWLLTYAGKLYVRKAQTILSVEETFMKDVNAITNFQKGVLSIGLTPFEEKHLIPVVLPIFNNKYPNIDVEIVRSTIFNMEKLILEGIVDFGIVMLPQINSEIEYIPIKNHKILLAICKKDPIAKDYKYPKKNEQYPELDISLLSRHSFIFMKEGHILREVASKVCKQSGFEPKVKVELGRAYAAHSLASAGYGVAFILDDIIEYQPMSKRAAYFRIKGQDIGQTIAFAYKKGKQLNEIEKEFLDILLKK